MLRCKRESCIIAHIVIFIANVYFHSADGAKIIFLPVNMNSHIILNIRLGESLARLGNEVHLIVPENSQVKHKSGVVNFTVSTYPVSGDIPYVNTVHFSKR